VRSIPIIAIASLALVSLTGCFEQQPLGDAPSFEPETPRAAQVGDCWEASGADVYEWPSWKGDGPVDCDERHQTYTFVAEQLDDDLEAWNGNEFTQEVLDEVFERCSTAFEQLGLTEDTPRVSWFFFVTPQRHWKKGDHGIRCDLAVDALGSPWHDPEIEDLPDDISELIDDVQKNPINYELCLMNNGAGPYETDENFFADCGGSYAWRWGGTWEYDTAEGDRYPGEDALYAFADSMCSLENARGSESPYPYIPTEQGWLEYGDHYIDCWFAAQGGSGSPV
jgi:hypothetical protein